MDRIRVRRLVVIGSGIVLGLAAVQAVAAAPPVKVVVGVAYTKADAHSVDNSNYTTVVSMSVPAGKYQVTGRITVQNQTGTTIDQMACNGYGNAGAGDVFIETGDGGNLTSGPAVTFPIVGVVALTAPGTIRIECISSSATFQNVGGRIVATTLADIVNVP
jgi:hypothetical protein